MDGAAAVLRSSWTISPPSQMTEPTSYRLRRPHTHEAFRSSISQMWFLPSSLRAPTLRTLADTADLPELMFYFQWKMFHNWIFDTRRYRKHLPPSLFLMTAFRSGLLTGSPSKTCNIPQFGNGAEISPLPLLCFLTLKSCLINSISSS